MMDIVHTKKVIAVEGKDEVNFFNSLLEHVEIIDFQIFDVVGKENFRYKLPALIKMTGFSDTERLAVIRDAETDAEASFKSIKDVLEKEGLKTPSQRNQFCKGKPDVGIFIMPGNVEKGMLEDLCLKTVQDHPAMECVNIFSDCVSRLNNPPKNMAKSKAQAFLAAMPKLVNSVGLGAKKGYWNFDSDELKDLKSFMENLR